MQKSVQMVAQIILSVLELNADKGYMFIMGLPKYFQIQQKRFLKPKKNFKSQCFFE